MKKIKILLIGSIELDLVVLNGYLLEYKKAVEIKTATNYDSAYEIYNSFRPDLIIIEPYGIGGIEFIKNIREQEYSGDVKTAIIAATSQNMIGDREMYLSAGFDSHIPKPIKFEELKKEIFNLVPKFSLLLEQAKNEVIPCRILTVTADPLMSVFTVKPLEQHYPGGAKIEITENSNETLKFLHKEFVQNFEDEDMIDVVLLDLDLPGRNKGPDAYQLSALIKSRYPQIICGGFTTFSTPERQKQSLWSGMSFLFDVSQSSEVLAKEITKALYPV